MRKGEYDTYMKDLGSTSPATAVLNTDEDESPIAWMLDGTLLVSASAAGGQYPIFKVRPGKPDTLEELTRTEIDSAEVSPNGRWLAYTSDDSGRPEISVMPLFQAGPVDRVTSQGGQAVTWSRDGRELYIARPPDILAVAVREENGRLKLERERLWAKVNGSNPEDIFEVGADGRILVDLFAGIPPPPQVRVVFGAAVELERKLRR
jgi:dipeptidyl aminopeptidase/acylaminoacyl peptidase